jgi:hypothetical protein
LAATLIHIAGETSKATDQTNENTMMGIKLQSDLFSKQTGMGGGDPKFVRAYSKYDYKAGKYVDYNASGQRLGAAEQEWAQGSGWNRTVGGAGHEYDSEAYWKQQPEIKITLQDQTSGGISAQTTNPGSYAPVPH